jgi:hypothetical protein
MLSMKNYRSSISKNARERVVATHLKGPQKYKVECVLKQEVVGIRTFEENGQLQYECPLKNDLRHGTVYFFSDGKVDFAEPYRNGFAHGTAKQWSDDGELIGTYTMNHGTGLDLWRAKKNWGTGSIYLSEARYIQNGKWNGFEWWLNEDQRSVHDERHFCQDQLHGIERCWNFQGRLRRGYPKYWIKGKRITKRQYISACAKDSTLPAFRLKDNNPHRDFPPEVSKHCTRPQTKRKKSKIN